MNTKQETQQRAMVAKLPREDLEDQHLRLLDDHNILKTHGRKQEERIKRMATKLIRLVNDRKKMISQGSSGVRRTAREVDLEETIETQQETIRQINKENEALKQKLRVVRQQMQTQGKRQTPYNRVQPRIDSRISRKPGESPEKARSTGRAGTDRMSTRTSSPQPSRYGHSLLEEARNENHNLHQQILALHEQIARMEDESQSLRREINKTNATHEDEVLNLREHVNLNHKSTLGDNIEMIKLQRQIKERSNDATTLEARYHEVQDDYKQLRSNYDHVLHEIERVKSQLIEQENRNLSLQNSLKHGSTHQRTISQLQEQTRELEHEVEILKVANDKLTHSAFDQEKEQQWRQLERKLRTQIAQLEIAIKADMSDKNNILDKISNERGYASRLHSESRRTYGELERIKMENEELRERLKLYTASDDSVDVDELREALSVIRQRRHAAAQRQRPDFLENFDETPKDLETEFSELQTQHADTIQELDKTREMLLMQHKINKDYQIEVESTANQCEEMKREYEAKMDKFARLLDARAARIKKLESQLHDVAYGTKQFKFQPDKEEIEVDDCLDETVQLERGENLFEINITKVTLTKEALSMLDDHDPSLFVTYAFYDYELVSTPIYKSSSPQFDFTAQFTVKVDDLFLHHLQKENTVFELHQAMGIDHVTIALCKIKFNQLLDKPQGKLHGVATLAGINGGNFGTLDFWVRLRVPMDQAIRLYRERTKALGYLSANTAATQKTLEVLDSKMDDTVAIDNNNQLLMQIISCNHVQGRREGIQPNIYCVYKFFDFADHDTVIIPSTNNPHFDDRQAYPVQMTSDLDAYLKSEKLVIYIFDDTDPDMSSYLGKASIDLLPLAHNKVIKAPFQLTKSDNTENGTIEIAARWQLTYRSPKVIMKGERSLEDEQEIKESQKLIKKPPVTPKKRQNVATKLPKPFAASTPKPVKHVESKSVMRKEPEVTIIEEPRDRPELVLLDEPEQPEPLHEEEPAEKPLVYEKPGHVVVVDVHREPEDHIEPETPEPTHQEPILVKQTKPTPVKRDKLKSTKRIKPVDDDESESIEELSDREAASSTSKKVSIIEPEKEKPVPFARSIRSVEVEEKHDFDEDSVDEISEIDETTPKVTYVKSNDEIDDEISSEVAPETERKSLTPPMDEDDLSEGESYDSQIDLSTKNGDGIEKKAEDDRENAEPSPIEEESEIEEDIEEIEEIPDDTGGVEEDKEDESKLEESDEGVGEETIDGLDDANNEKSDTICISINHLTLDPNTSIWGDTSIDKMFVEYEFLGSVEETPDAVMKPKNKDEKLNFQFENEIKVDASAHAEQRNRLSSMITSGQTSFKMTIVSEPNNDEDEECEEIGTATVDLAAILKNGRDIINDDVTVEDLRKPAEVVGKLNVRVEALAVLREIRNELDLRLRESES